MRRIRVTHANCVRTQNTDAQGQSGIDLKDLKRSKRFRIYLSVHFNGREGFWHPRADATVRAIMEVRARV